MKFCRKCKTMNFVDVDIDSCAYCGFSFKEENK